MGGFSTLPQVLISLFLCGDVMTGRGIDQVLPHPNDPRLYEPYVTDARVYVELAEKVHGPIPRPMEFSALWGEALAELQRRQPDVRLINLETAVTSSPEAWPGKGINYRMHPENLTALTAAGIDLVVLANNHVLDWGYRGLEQTLESLQKAGIQWAGAGPDLAAAQAPAVVEIPGKGRVLVFAFGTESSGVPAGWGAGAEKPGVHLLTELSAPSVRRIGQLVAAVKRPGDIALASIHWGGNWGFAIPEAHQEFAHRLIDEAGIDAIHGHSSHHVLGIEVYRGKLILYGCGDLLTDYEGISGQERFRADLGLMYFPRFDAASGALVDLQLVPTRVRHFRLARAPEADARWLEQTLNREGQRLGTRVERGPDQSLLLHWR